MSDETRVDEIFLEIVELPQARRAAALEDACRDAEMRRRVEQLLESDSRLPADFLGGDKRQESAPASNAAIGPYRILERLGEGGMGTVYAARQSFPERDVALKVLRAGRVSTDTIRRFRLEIDVLGRLQHSGIAQIYDAGVTEETDESGAQQDVPYFTMELVRGVPLVRHARERGLPLRARIELLARVCDAVHYAHQRGVIHRDLKSENVLVSCEESTALQGAATAAEVAIGQPKVLDFGIARVIDSDAAPDHTCTLEGALLGTLSSMSPEQVSGAGALVDVRTDVYALGVMFYELLCGRPPIVLDGLTVVQAVQRVLEEEIEAPGADDPKLRGDLSTIVMKALNRDPERRYQTALDLARDLRCHLRGEPIEARADSRMYLARRSLRRHRMALSVVLVFALLLAVFAVTSAQQARESKLLAFSESRARQLADEDFERALASLDLLTDLGTRRLVGIPGAESTRRELVQAALDFHRGLLEAHPAQPSLRRRQAVARFRIAKLERSLGNQERALDEVRVGVQELESIRAEPGEDAAAVEEGLGLSLILLGHLLYRENRLDEAEDALQRAIELARTRLESDATLESGDYERFGSANRHLSICLQRRDEIEAGRAVVVETIPVIEQGLSRFDTIALRAELAALLQQSVVFSMNLGQQDNVERDTLRAIQIVESLRDREPGIPRHPQDLIGLHNNFSTFLGGLGRTDEAQQESDRAIAIGELLLADHPDLERPRENLFDAYSNRANGRVEAGELDAAQQDMSRAGELLDGLIARSGDSALLAKRALLLHNQGSLFMRSKEYDAALVLLEQCLERVDAHLAQDPNSRFMRTLRRYALINLASSQAQLGDNARADPLLRDLRYVPGGASSTAEVSAALQAWQTMIVGTEQRADLDPAQLEAMVERIEDRAVEYLSEAIAAGFEGQSVLAGQKELKRLLQSAVFRAALELR